MKDRVPDLLVEQLLLGELSPNEATRVRAQLEADHDPRLERLEASNAAILEENPPEAVARRIRARLDALEPEPEPAFRWPVWGTAAAVAVAAGALLMIALPSGTTNSVDPGGVADSAGPATSLSGGERIKGDAAVVLERKLGTRAEPLLAGSTVSPGDMIQIGYRSGGWTHGVLVSLDGAGAVTLHFPDDAGASTELQPAAVLHGFELDDAPDFERFLFFTANEPLEPSAVLEAVEVLAKRPDAQTAVVDPAPAEAVVDLPLLRHP